ncbi:MAG TPA: aldo/keto reductase [Lapillicoccus sp.]|jgi:diketogulonate reductase-like aldo/keto reductase|uniref:aldo/keto reductase n=1 Tax=Lapillicoccus sp. TaxID=1909287 RepID=UPI002F92AA55
MSVLTEAYTLRNGTQIPQVGFGTWLLEEGNECYDAVADALRLGYRHIDTARAYGNEASVGRAIRDSGIPREQLYITSKLPAEAKAYDRALEEFETTMDQIGLDYLDLYLIHAPWPWDEIGKDCRRENQQIWKAMEEFLATGRVKAIGVSNFETDDLNSLLPACETLPMVNQIKWFIGLDPSATVATCAENDIIVEAYSPFAHGLIVNHPEITDIAAGYDVSAPQLCIRYLLQRGAVVLPKATTTAHIAQNAELDFVISDADLAVLDAMRDTDQHDDAMEFRWS